MSETLITTQQPLQRWMYEQLKLGLRGAHFMIAGGVIGVAFILYGGTGHQSVLLWAIYLLLCEALLGLTMLIRIPLDLWMRAYGVIHLIACVGWGLVPLLFFLNLPTAYQELYALLVVAAAVISQPTLSYVPRLYLLGIAIMLLPVAAMLSLPLFDGQFGTGGALGVFLLATVLFLAAKVRMQYRYLREQASELLHLDQARKALKEHQDQLYAERAKAEAAGKWDPVTGTHIQSGFIQALEKHAKTKSTIVICLRIAGFKYVNMAFGREVGNEVLREIAARLVGVTSDPVQVCRTGGGEFLAFFDAGQEKLESDLKRLTQKPCRTSQGSISVDAYIGMSLPQQQGGNAMEVLYKALHAAEQAKSDGFRGVLKLPVDEQASQQKRHRSLMRFALSDAISDNEFHLVFQPKHRLADHKLVGFEALLRWQNRSFGAVSPSEFIPIAEEAGLIIELGNWVIAHAIEEFRKNFSDTGLSLSLNISLPQLQAPDFVDRITAELDKNSLSAHQLILEVTESLFMSSPDLIADRLTVLRNSGVKVSLDDFGTGYSSLSYLKEIPLDEVKIDRAFVMDIAENSVSRTLVISLLQICQALNLDAVIEGVEDQQQLDTFRKFPNVIIQGFLFSRPMRIKQAREYVRANIDARTD